MHRRHDRVSAGHRHRDGFDDQLRGLTSAHGPADESPAIEVLDAGHVELALPRHELGDVGHPALIGSAGTEVPFQQVGSRGHLQAASSPLLAGVHAHEVELGHEASDPFAPDPGADQTELAVDPWRSVGAPRAPVDLSDGVGQIGVADTT
jgi:hypothetical protein